ncbi:manganese efflux pump [Paenibacillus taichungensis]|uniref:manganese efflux pump n=1 Tax=Paenibacillus TaxID=44249 RepID=UPI000C190B9B|nr:MULTISPECIES: manganese efflux pump [Paenibacillus]MEC0111494.1 manganese efflux pump [Paenibacillus taichungensis]MEC0197575.1 manganese efflux pump [Paenibacillus taichungensis]PIH59709.1 sporulation membrane protein YtaF [Paenibacillus sp. LK1]
MLHHFISLMALALALSLDGFGVGITYGLRRTKIPLLSIVVISICSGLVIALSMQVGVLLSHVVSPDVASIVGAVILIGIGAWSLLQLIRKRGKEQLETDNGVGEGTGAGTIRSSTQASPEAQPKGRNQVLALELEPSASGGSLERMVFTLELRKLGVVIQILRSPSKADMDNSGSISVQEAMWLGIALSLDAFGAGLGAALLGFPTLWTALVIALFSGAFLSLGMKVGLRFAALRWMRRLSVLPALLLMFMGIMKLL